MNARISTPMLSPSEAEAHLIIIDAAERGHMNEISHGLLLQLTWRPLESFRPRCNCRRVLTISPWVDGVRHLHCNWCGFSAKESL